MKPPRWAWPVLIAGAGAPSLSFALALKQAAGRAVDVTIVAPPARGAVPGQDGRAFALSGGSVAFLTAVGLWESLGRLSQPITRMQITDSRLGDAVRQTYLTFDAPSDEPLGFMIEGAPLLSALADGCRAAGIAFAEGRAAETALGDGDGSITVTGPGLEPGQASLVVAADGARSRLREGAGIGWSGRPYGQVAIVATVGHERDHRGLAVQHFLPGGPLAILPLSGPGRTRPHRSSIVWTERSDRARTILAADPATALATLGALFGPEWGAPSLETPLASHPLGVGLARRFVAPRFALLGDAAHEIHPLAGQGLNLALADAAALAEHVVNAVRLGLDPGGEDVLSAYERDRRFDAVALAGLTDGLNRLFSNNLLPARVLRDLGLGLVDRSGAAKRLLGGGAAGRGGRAPRLLRGEPL